MYYGEKLNSITHLIGAVLALIGFGALLTIGIQTHDVWVITSFSIYGITLVLLYTMSTLYHSFQSHQIKEFFLLMDHIAIYLLISGTYTPYMLVSIREGNGWLILGIVWGLALIGILSEIFLEGKAIKIGQMMIYLGMGWACSFDLSSLKEAIPSVGYILLIVGGLAYTIGVIFYVLGDMKKLTHGHGIWHFFVLFGSVCHFISILGYVR
jgi:hemolysin III